MKAILFTTLLLFSINGFAFDWVKVLQGTSGDIYYFDVKSAKKREGDIYHWVLVDLMEPIEDAKSMVTKYKTNCDRESRTTLQLIAYDQPMGKGKVVGQQTAPNEANYPPPNSVGYRLIDRICEVSRVYLDSNGNFKY